MKRIGYRWHRLACLFGILAAAYACGEQGTAAPPRGLTSRDSIAEGYFDRPPTPSPISASVRAQALASGVGISYITPFNPKGAYIGWDQTSVVTAVLTGPVGSVAVTGNGAIQCSGSYGSLQALDATGAVIATSSLHLIDQSDCSPPKNPDNVTFGATAIVIAPAGKTIASAKITPMSPFRFDVFDDFDGYASAVYTITLGAGAPAETLQVAPTSASRKEAQTVTYTATSKSGKAVVVTSWGWVGSGPPPTRGGKLTQVPATCHTSTTCTLPVYESGTLTVYGTVLGVPAAPGSATATKTACPADADTMVMAHNPSFRKALSDLFHALTPPYEQGLQTYINPADSLVAPITYPNILIGNPNTNACVSYLPDMKNPSNAVPDSAVPMSIDVHTHPWIVDDSIPQSCNYGKKPMSGPVTKTLVGPSPDDYKTAHNEGFEGWIVAKDGYVYRFNYAGAKTHRSARWKFDSDANGQSSCFIADTKWKG
jgi:hypothetical protein